MVPICASPFSTCNRRPAATPPLSTKTAPDTVTLIRTDSTRHMHTHIVGGEKQQVYALSGVDSTMLFILDVAAARKVTSSVGYEDLFANLHGGSSQSTLVTT